MIDLAYILTLIKRKISFIAMDILPKKLFSIIPYDFANRIAHHFYFMS